LGIAFEKKSPVAFWGKHDRRTQIRGSWGKSWVRHTSTTYDQVGSMALEGLRAIKASSQPANTQVFVHSYYIKRISLVFWDKFAVSLNHAASRLCHRVFDT